MFFGLLLLGGTIYATERTYPGDYLYPFKLKFEGFVLATSKILNKQVDFSIDLVNRRSKEVAKILTPKNSAETLSRLDTQVELTAISISQMSDSVEKKKAAEKYIVKLNEVSSVLNEKQKEFVTPPPVQQVQPPSNQPTTPPESVSQEIDSSQQTIEQTIEEMNIIVDQPAVQDEIPTTIPTIFTPTNVPEHKPDDNDNREKEKENDSKKGKNKDKKD